MTSKNKKRLLFAGIAGIAAFIFRKPLMAGVEKLKARIKK